MNATINKLNTEDVVFKLLAVGFFWIGLQNTTATFAVIRPNGEWWEAVVAQLLLTLTQHSIYARGDFNPISSVSLAIDSLLNSGGIYPALLLLGGTPPFIALVDAFNLTGAIPEVIAYLFAVGLGAIVAGAPEYCWNMASRKRG